MCHVLGTSWRQITWPLGYRACNKGHEGSCGRQERPRWDLRDGEGVRWGVGRTAFQAEGPVLSIGVKRDGLQFHPIAHADVQLASKLIARTHVLLAISLGLPLPSLVIICLNQYSPSSQVCRFPPSHSVCSPTAAKVGQSPHQAWPMFEQLSGSPQSHLAESDP